MKKGKVERDRESKHALRETWAISRSDLDYIRDDDILYHLRISDTRPNACPAICRYFNQPDALQEVKAFVINSDGTFKLPPEDGSSSPKSTAKELALQVEGQGISMRDRIRMN